MHTLARMISLADDPNALNPGFLALGVFIFVLIAAGLFIYFQLRKPKP